MAWIITRDDRMTYGRYDTQLDALGELHKRVGYSADHAVEHEGYAFVEVPDDKWGPLEAKTLRGMSHQKLNSHGHSAADTDPLTLENCGAHALHGYEATADGPNYTGWARVYVQSGTPVPSKWCDGFWRELHDDENPLYVAALVLDIATWGLLGPCRHRLTETTK